MNAFGRPQGGNLHNPNNDYLVSNPPNDTISELAFSPKSLLPKNFVAAGTWDNEVRLWEINADASTNMLMGIRHDGPVLSVSWREDGQAVLSGGADKIAKMWDLTKQQAIPVAQHDQPIRCVRYIGQEIFNQPVVATGSWDKTVRYWDLRAPTGQAMGVVQVPDRVYAMAVRGRMLVVGTAERKIVVYDLANPAKPFYEKDSQLKHQTRCIATFPDGNGFAVGGVEGRVSIDHVRQLDRRKDFAFKCHRDANSNIYAVNSIAFHDEYSTFATAGSDGGICFWDKEAKSKLKAFEKVNQSITSCSFNADGKIFGYSVGYDWSKGAFNHNPDQYKSYILLHAVQDSEVKGGDKKARR